MDKKLPDTLFGKPVVETDFMPAGADTDKPVIIMGPLTPEWAAAYLADAARQRKEFQDWLAQKKETDTD